MKLVCDCGNEMVFDPGKKISYQDDSIIVRQDRSKIEVIAEHDEAWVICKKCKKSITFSC